MTNNVSQITDKQPTPSAKFTITAALDGFPIVIEGERLSRQPARPD